MGKRKPTEKSWIKMPGFYHEEGGTVSLNPLHSKTWPSELP